MSEHSNHRTAIMPDMDKHDYRPWCHDCEEFYAWEGSEYENYD